MKTPYSTGKVLIGCRYQPTQTWTPSRTELDLQAALLQPLSKRTGKPASNPPGHRTDKCPGIFVRALRSFWRWA